ncbi:MAG: isoleucine--tRNA ligase [Phycisphaerales bacterium]|nr:MAG: isoleucine--tRNA ligase [Phycisphaerales bacterium]
MSKTTTKNFKDTLNLPRTSFPMRANLAQNEPQSQKRWSKERLYEQVIRTREESGAQPFVFHDGPPYANGSIHVGHLLNKVLKDFVVRAKLMQGEVCRYIPGWDCHGLPIEHKVMTELFEKGKQEKFNALGEDQRRMAVRRECAKYAEKFIKLQSGQMQRLLTLADYDEPYLTMDPAYEASVLEVFAALVERGLVYRALKPVHWSVANRTALAEAELEYEDRKDPSIYVDFDVAPDSRAQIEKAFGVELDQTPSLMIWTTTPWTLPANLAIAVHERYRYALVQMDGNVTVLASDLVKKVAEIGGASDVEVLAECDGAALVGVKYRHPFCERTSPVVSAEYVTLEDGTGLVHTAPGHGSEDYQTGLREKLEIYCPVQGDGTFDDTVPDWLQGKSIWDANPEIIQHLEKSGHMFHHHVFTHSYPHDWRSKTPVIFRATEQWFVGVDEKLDGTTLRELALNATRDEVKFVPEWGRNRMRGMLESRPDWCLSRQRAWGLPIPAFFGPEEGQVLLTPASVRAVAQLIEEKGSDVWFQADAESLLQHYDASKDEHAPDWVRAEQFSAANLTKGNDIFDVWFESGSSWHAVMQARGLARKDGPVTDLYLEGSDQHRGWFQVSLLPCLGVTGRAPYRTVLTHGFMVDKDGRKMSKSGGNALDVDELLKNFGADVCRWWVSSLAYEGDIKVDLDFFKVASESYRKVRNTLRFLLSNLADFERGSFDLSNIAPASLDGYALAEASRVQAAVLKAYNDFQFRRAHLTLFDFCNETMSAFYNEGVKDRLYCDRSDAPRRRATQATMFRIAEMLCHLLSPVLPHTADEAWRALWNDEGKCLALESIRPLEVSTDPEWAHVLEVREQALKALEEAKKQGIGNSLDAELVLPDPRSRLARFEDELPDAFGVSRVRLDSTADKVAVNDLRSEPRCERSWKRDGTVKQRADGSMLSDRDAEAIGAAE